MWQPGRPAQLGRIGLPIRTLGYLLRRGGHEACAGSPEGGESRGGRGAHVPRSAQNHLRPTNGEALAVFDQPGGGRKREVSFLAGCMATVREGTAFVEFDRLTPVVFDCVPIPVTRCTAIWSSRSGYARAAAEAWHGWPATRSTLGTAHRSASALIRRARASPQRGLVGPRLRAQGR